jgi:hypothetical protein
MLLFMYDIRQNSSQNYMASGGVGNSRQLDNLTSAMLEIDSLRNEHYNFYKRGSAAQFFAAQFFAAQFFAARFFAARSFGTVVDWLI